MKRGFDRRALLRYGAIGGAAALTRPVLAREASAAAAEPVPPFELEEATVVDLQRRMESGQDSARSLCEKYRTRIDALDRKGPALRALLETNPDALSIADEHDAERKAGRTRGPLHGIP